MSQTLLGKILTRIERWWTRSHLNPVATLYVNLRLLPIKEALRFPIYIYGCPSLMDLSGSATFTCPLKRGLVKMNIKDLAPYPRGNDLELAVKGTIVFGGAALVRSNSKVFVDSGATLRIGHNLRMGFAISINCFHDISIGEGVRIGHRSQLFDSNLHFMVDMKRRRVPTLRKSIEIGSHCWLTNTVTVLGGGVVPPYSVVASGTVVNKDLSALGEGNIIGGVPVRVLAEDMRLVNNYAKEHEIDEFYRANPDGMYTIEGDIDTKEWFENKR